MVGSLNVSTAQYEGLRLRQHMAEHTGHTHSSIEIKIFDPAGNRTRATGLEGRDPHQPRHDDGHYTRTHTHIQISDLVKNPDGTDI